MRAYAWCANTWGVGGFRLRFDFIRREAPVYDPQDIRHMCLHMSRHSGVICGLIRKLDPNARAYDALVMPRPLGSADGWRRVSEQHALPVARLLSDFLGWRCAHPTISGIQATSEILEPLREFLLNSQSVNLAPRKTEQHSARRNIGCVSSRTDSSPPSLITHVALALARCLHQRTYPLASFAQHPSTHVALVPGVSKSQHERAKGFCQNTPQATDLCALHPAMSKL